MNLLNYNSLIHVALPVEARAPVSRFGLRQQETRPFRVFRNQSTVLVVSGVGKSNVLAALSYIYRRYRFHKAINFGMAGATSHDIDIGSLVCCYGTLEGVPVLPLSTHNEPVTVSVGGQAALVDMEGEHFLNFVSAYQDSASIWILKVVSDFLSDKILDKETIDSLLAPTIPYWEGILTI